MRVVNDTSCSFKAHNNVNNASKVNYICLTNCSLTYLKQLISTRHSKRVPWLKTKQNKQTDRYGNMKMNLAKEWMRALDSQMRTHSAKFSMQTYSFELSPCKENQLINTISKQWNHCIQISEQFSVWTFHFAYNFGCSTITHL